MVSPSHNLAPFSTKRTNGPGKKQHGRKLMTWEEVYVLRFDCLLSEPKKTALLNEDVPIAIFGE
ncbi:hypothetical protein HK24_09615 [Gluconobacter sp. DsW_058]|nr:hypothetical protein HK24_09615 [Gluconobacter sp. DsW_058]